MGSGKLRLFVGLMLVLVLASATLSATRFAPVARSTQPTSPLGGAPAQDGSDLALSAHPLGRPSPAVQLSAPDDSGPGEIYPSIVDVPKAGCWVFTFRWHGNTDTLDLPYH